MVEGGKLLVNSDSHTQMAISLSEERPPVYCISQTRLHKLNSLKVQMPERSMNFSQGQHCSAGASSIKVATLDFV